MLKLPFESKISPLEEKIKELAELSGGTNVDIEEEIGHLREKLDEQLGEIYSNLTAWEKVQVARHEERPHFLDYLENICSSYEFLRGDRYGGEDRAIKTALGIFRGRTCIVIGTEKGSDTEDRIRHNFGMPNPEGYHKVCRVLGLASRFNFPVISLVDTAGAYPGLSAEERGQGYAVARSLEANILVRAPFVSVITGEGGSGGAVALAAADKVYMLEYSIYSVISPEGCSSILWKNQDNIEQAAGALKLTAYDLERLGLITEVIKEPIGGAHRNAETMYTRVGDKIEEGLQELEDKSIEEIVRERIKKYAISDMSI